MLFSDEFSISRQSGDDWLDISLDTDTKLFVDPFLIFYEKDGDWANAHAAIIHHFQVCFDLIVEGRLQPNTLPYKKALRLLTFKEPREFCLGYTAMGSNGAGGGPGYARLMARAMVEAVKRGLADLEHFEELGILEKGIGPDRISDLTCNILKSYFIEYTKQVAARHDLETIPQRVRNSKFDEKARRWISEVHNLPRNPATNLPLLLVPERFIRDVPALNADAWWDDFQADQLREDVNYEVLTHVDKETIVRNARRHPDAVRNWTEQQEKKAAPQSYDIERDPQGVLQWEPASKDYVEANPLKLTPPTNADEFSKVIDLVISEFKHFIEEQRGWKLLWNENGKEKNEEAAQLLFFGIARNYCKANNVVIDREVELGRGPVDFKFSNGHTFRALLEVKKLHSGSFWSGLEQQLPSYMLSDECDHGWYMAIRYREEGTSSEWAQKMPNTLKRLSDETKKAYQFNLIDATPKASASKIKPEAA